MGYLDQAPEPEQAEEQSCLFRDNWQPQKESRTRLEGCGLALALPFLFVIYAGDYALFAVALALVALYVASSVYCWRIGDDERGYYFLQGDAVDVAKTRAMNTFIRACLDSGAIPADARWDAVYAELVSVSPLVFHLTLSQAHYMPDGVVEKMAPALNASRGSCEKVSAQTYRFSFFEDDIAAAGAAVYEWEEPVRGVDIAAIPVGVDLDTGKEITISLKESNLLVGGATRAGKSCFANCLIANLCAAHNVALLLIDPKRTEQVRYKARASAYINNQKDADKALKALVAEMERRYAFLEEKGNGATKIRTGKRFCAIVVLMDEMSYLLNSDDKKLNESVIASLTTLQQVALAAGISVVGMTQKPSVEALGKGSSAMRSQFIQRCAFRCSSAEDVATILSGDSRLYPAEQLPKAAKGVCYIASENTPNTRLMKGYFIDDEKVKEMAAKYANLRVPLPWLDEALKEEVDGE